MTEGTLLYIISLENIMDNKSYLIKDTTVKERIELIKQWIPADDAMADCGMDLWDIYDDYIKGKKEIAQINESLVKEFYTEDDL